MNLLFKIIALSLLLFNPKTTHAYQFTRDFQNGFYWQTLPIMFEIVGANQGERQRIYDLVYKAQRTWEDSIAKSIWNLTLGKSSVATAGSNTIRWSNNFAAETGFDPNVTLAVTTRYTQGTFVSKSEIILNGSSSQMRNDPNLLYRTILHELGHTVGLDHTNLNAVMYPYISMHEQPQPDDVAGIDALINETLYRQGVSYISPLAEEEFEQQYASCGSINLNDQNGPSNFLFSLFFGILVIIGIKKVNYISIMEETSHHS